MQSTEDTPVISKDNKILVDEFEARMMKVFENKFMPGVRDIKEELSDIKRSLVNYDIQIDEIRAKDIPEMESRVDNKLERAILYAINMDVHSRKWNLIINGLPGAENEPSDTTRQKVVDFGMNTLGAGTTRLYDFSACHRLKNSINAPVIVRFVDLSQRDYWLVCARNLRNVSLINNTPVGICPNLPPVLAKLRKDAFTKRANLSVQEKAKSQIKYLPKWPYVVLMINGEQQTPDITKADLISQFLSDQSALDE